MQKFIRKTNFLQLLITKNLIVEQFLAISGLDLDHSPVLSNIPTSTFESAIPDLKTTYLTNSKTFQEKVNKCILSTHFNNTIIRSHKFYIQNNPTVSLFNSS